MQKNLACGSLPNLFLSYRSWEWISLVHAVVSWQLHSYPPANIKFTCSVFFTEHMCLHMQYTSDSVKQSQCSTCIWWLKFLSRKQHEHETGAVTCSLVITGNSRALSRNPHAYDQPENNFALASLSYRTTKGEWVTGKEWGRSKTFLLSTIWRNFLYGNAEQHDGLLLLIKRMNWLEIFRSSGVTNNRHTT